MSVQVPALGPGEQILWERQLTKGVFKKEVVAVERISNFRVSVNTSTVGLGVLEDVLVMNAHSVSQGSYVSTGRGVRVGMGSSKSRTVGDVVFMYKGKQHFIFHGIADPHGLVRLVKSSMKTMKAAVKEEMKKAGVSSIEELQAKQSGANAIPQGEPDATGPACPKCGTATMSGAKFCASCGLPL